VVRTKRRRATTRSDPSEPADEAAGQPGFSPQVIDRFLRVRETMFDVIRRAEDERVKRAQQAALQQEQRARRERERVAGLERLAQQETVITPKTRWLALVPFGAGSSRTAKEPGLRVFEQRAGARG